MTERRDNIIGVHLTRPQKSLMRIAVAIALFIVTVPVLVILSVSIRSPDTVYQAHFFIIPKSFSLENYVLVGSFFERFLEVSIARMFMNSTLVTGVSIIISLCVTVLSGFSFSNYRFKGREVLFLLFLTVWMVPYQIILIPLYLQLNRFGLLNTYLALILPYVTVEIPLGVLIFRRFFEEIPLELRDAARIDGSTDFGYLAKIVLPLSRPALATVIILLFLSYWNEFLFAFLFIRDYEMQTIPAVIARVGGTTRTVVPWGTYSAALMVVIIPIMIVFFAFQRWFIRGMTMGAIKG